MARLKLPEKAYKNKYSDEKWHLCWGGIPGPTMVCSNMLFKVLRVEKLIEDIDPENLCEICLGAIEVEK